MNLSINTATPNYNCQRKNSPNFGMAVLVDKKAIPVIKEQAMKLSSKAKKEGVASAYEKFWTNFNETVDRQNENPVNIIVKKIFGRKALKAVVVDSTAESAVKNTSFSQGILSKNGSLKFLEKAEAQADKLNNTNSRVADFNIAEKIDYKAGARQAEEASLQ